MTSYDQRREKARQRRRYWEVVIQYRGIYTRGHLVRHAREHLGLSRDELRERMDIKSPVTVSRLEGVHAPITRLLWVKLCMALEVTPEEGIKLVYAEPRS